LFSIHSVSSDRELIFRHHLEKYFQVELKSASISLATDVWATAEYYELNTFFQQLASFKTPWQGTQSWGSFEREFEISATCTTLGQVIFLVKLSGLSGNAEEWQGQTGLETEFGQLEKIAWNANIFFKTEDFGTYEE